MADAQKPKDDDSIYAGNPKDPSSYQSFPARPTTMQKLAESFQPDETKIMINQIRKRRGLPSDSL